MKALVLTEGGRTIGFGHVARCVSLAEAFEEHGIESRLIVNGDETVKDVLRPANHQIFDWTGNRLGLRDLTKDFDIAVIDSYRADMTWYQDISRRVEFPVYIDDNKRIDYPGGTVLNGSVYAEDLLYPNKAGVRYLLGSRYISLRKAFWSVPEKTVNERIERILVTLGGDDLRNMTHRILGFLSTRFPDLIKLVVIGRGFQNVDQITAVADENTDISYYPNVDEMKALMLEADVAVCAGGHTLNELASTGTPAISVAVTDNQLRHLSAWLKIGFIEDAGWWEDRTLFDGMDRSLERLMDAETRRRMAHIGRSLVDGRGSSRAIDDMLCHGEPC